MKEEVIELMNQKRELEQDIINLKKELKQVNDEILQNKRVIDSLLRWEEDFVKRHKKDGVRFA